MVAASPHLDKRYFLSPSLEPLTCLLHPPSPSYFTLFSYLAVGEFVCSALFLQCNEREGPTECPENKPAPKPVCEEDCKTNAKNRADHCKNIVQERGLLPPSIEAARMCAIEMSIFDESDESLGNAAEVLGTRHFRNLVNFGEKLYSSAPDICPIDGNADGTKFFARDKATQFVTSCPLPFLINDAVEFDESAEEQARRFCVSPCPVRAFLGLYDVSMTPPPLSSVCSLLCTPMKNFAPCGQATSS